MTDGRNFFYQQVKNDIWINDKISKVVTGQGDHDNYSCLLDYPYSKKHYKMRATDLSKQWALDSDPKAIQKINSTKNSDQTRNTIMFLIIQESKETILNFSQGNVRVLQTYFALI